MCQCVSRASKGLKRNESLFGEIASFCSRNGVTSLARDEAHSALREVKPKHIRFMCIVTAYVQTQQHIFSPLLANLEATRTNNTPTRDKTKQKPNDWEKRLWYSLALHTVSTKRCVLEKTIKTVQSWRRVVWVCVVCFFLFVYCLVMFPDDRTPRS